MAKAKKLPSGNWRVKAYIGVGEDGKKKSKSFTAPTKKEAEYMASEYVMNIKYASDNKILFKDAMLNMVELKRPVISPSTYRTYMQYCTHNYFDSIKNTPVTALTDKQVQKMVNNWIEDDLSAKTIQNLHSFFISIVKNVDKRIVFDTKLPHKYKSDIYIPTDEEVSQLINASADTPLELPILLAAFMGLRRSEIVALKWSDVDFENKKLSINEATVLGIDNQPTTKKPKSVSGQRTIDIPSAVLDSLLRHRNDNDVQVVPLTGASIYKRFKRLQEQLNMNDFRFHDLRHYNASVMLALGIPDKYAMERIGHASNAILKNVYQHTQKKKQSEFSTQLDKFFNQI